MASSSRGTDALVIALALSIAVLASWPLRFDAAAPPMPQPSRLAPPAP